jgi:hypothetical protein
MISGTRVALLAIAGVAAAATARPAEQEAGALADHIAQVERLTAGGGVMITDNARYAADDGGQTHYGQYFERVPGGMSARGCLWGERDGEIQGVSWYFYTGWDPARGRGFFYQSASTGYAGFGHGEPLGEVGHVTEQRFSGEGMAARLRHEARWFGTDSVSMRSFDADLDGDWRPRREYTWVRAQRTPPC